MKTPIQKLMLIILMAFPAMVSSQNIGINNPNPDASAVLDLSATDKGLLIPRMSAAQRLAIPSPATGLMVYEITSSQFFYYNGVQWISIGASGNEWSRSGNSGTNLVNNFIGTTDNVGLSFRTNNNEQMRITEQGGVLFTGNLNGFTPVSGAGVRTMWLPHRAAFRTGQVFGSFWDDSNIGEASFASNTNNTASGAHTVAMGNENTASGFAAMTFGSFNQVSGAAAAGIGFSNNVSGSNSIVLGENNEVVAQHSVIVGNNIETNVGTEIFSFGKDNFINTPTSFSFGKSIQMTGGNQSFAVGSNIQMFQSNDCMIIGKGGSFPLTDFQMPGNSMGLGMGSNIPTLILTSNPLFNQTGNVGINTFNPTAKLEIVGDGQQVFHVKDQQGNSLLYVDDFDKIGVNTNLPISSFDVRGTGNNSFSSSLSVMNNNLQQLLFVRDDGNTGVGTQSPVSRLHVADPVATTTTLSITNGTGGNSQGMKISAFVDAGEIINQLNGPLLLGTANTPSLIFQSNNTLGYNGTSFGVGTLSPAARLHVNGTVRIENGTQAAGKVLTSDALGNATWQTPAGLSGWTLNGNAGTTVASNFVGTTDNNALAIRTNNTDRIRVTATGQVGVGTANPNSTFHTAGSMAVSVRVSTGSTTLTASDYCLIFTTATGIISLNIPAPLSCPGRVYAIVNHSNASVSLNTNIKVDASIGRNGILTGEEVVIVSDGTSWHAISRLD